nr:retron system putative HNH endonuclease [uncultured Duganella sp.]
MKRVKKSVVSPPLLDSFLALNPLADWEKFRKSNKRYKEVAKAVQEDQRGICAYCEIDFLENTIAPDLPDFRIEHFHPKSPHNPPPNWSLEWNNLLGACHGGSQKDVSDPTRFTAPDFCCDVPKGSVDLTDHILNPLVDIPAFPRIFNFSENSGKIDLDSDLCPPDRVMKARGTVRELNLNAPRLTRMRRAVMRELGDQIEQLLESGLAPAEAALVIAKVMFPDPSPNRWPAFFTCVRWYLGPAAETQLEKIGYVG